MLWVTLHPQKDIEVLSSGSSEHNLTGNYSFCGCKQDKMRSYCRGQGPYSSITDLFLFIWLFQVLVAARRVFFLFAACRIFSCGISTPS